ncbi:MAG: universal stress protein [Bacteroidia bacterium]|nr:universal stress protein [Bacteroidia bacterium]MBT8275448.1 universal stress protein [Bacteroidia bacterium]NNJ82522.1 universal stress protein [Flavobacteriaceae bacterium]NNK54458.1 universal stress protein [Flavobacteriaceae bacterium]NNM08070.1 universal stress protein [Flavobacteriaceae bacterium]
MRRKILLPTDFSRNAWDAITYAVDLFKNEACDFYILNVYNFTGYAMDNIIVAQPNNEYAEAVREKSMKGLERILQQLSFRDEGIDHTYFTISKNDNLMDAIKEIVKLKDIDLVVMGTKGDTDAINVSFGSNTVMVMEKERNCPVMAVPPQVQYSAPSEIVFPTSYKTHFKKRELAYLIDIAKITNAPIRVLHVETEDQLDEKQLNYKKMLEEYFEDIDHSFHNLEKNDIGEAIQLFVQSRGSGMIAFINRKHTFFGSIFSRPLVKELGIHSKVPVLAMHDFRN